MNENRNERLARDYREMLKIQNRPYLSWIATKGEPPYAEEYLLTIDLRSYALSTDRGKYIVGAISRCVVRVTLWDSYPHVAPNIRMLNLPPVFHPDWYSKGGYCSSEPWREDCSLKDHILRMLGTIRYEPGLMETVSPANYKALDWYMKRREDTALFPSDPTELTENTPEEAIALEQTSLPFDEIIDEF